ncbi:MAG: hypothetical protein MUO85_02405 [candidate division Zixibacteria bacterium]|nr:hypothetical protein [candidate division Zixibacteria bacterium]
MRRLSIFLILLLIFGCRATGAIEITGGKIIDVVVADSGSSDSTFHTQLYEGWPVGPESFDIDEEGNIYVLDVLKILKFDRGGKWITTFKGISKSGKYEGESFWDIAVDNCGSIYVVKALRIMKFSPQGKFLLQTEDIPEYSNGGPSWVIGSNIEADKSGRIYNPHSRDGIVVYDQELKLKQVILMDAWHYSDVGIVQKDVSNDIYFRQNKYIFRTSLEEYSQSGKIDTAAVLPKEITNPRFLIKRTSERYPPPPNIFCPFIGFDKDSCFYFYKDEQWYGKKETRDICRRFSILKYKLERNRMNKFGEVVLDVPRDNEECSSTGLHYSYKQFIVTGDGTVYWLHGTVDTVKVSKIIID